MKVVYSDRYQIDIGTHVYPTAKYHLVRAQLLATGCASAEDVVEPFPVSWEDLALVHTPEYLDKVRFGRLTPDEIAELEIPWSAAIVEGFRLMTGGTVLAARLALSGSEGGGRSGILGEGARAHGMWTPAAHLGGGFHHAFANHGEGFCLFNDVAVAIRVLTRAGVLTRVAVIDVDVHQGNGTAFIFEGDPSVFTFSIHEQHNYPLFKPRGSLDVGLESGADDETYLRALAGALPRVFDSRPDLAFYLAGADPYRDDQLGGLALTYEGLRARDRQVLEGARAAGVPVAIVLAGGYARRIEDTVAIHLATLEEAARVASRVLKETP